MREAAVTLLISVAMHVTWNLIARQQPKEAHPLWWFLLAHLVIFGPWGIYSLALTTDWSISFALMLAVSASGNVLYFVGVQQAYAYAPVALVYPLVRSSPLLIALWGIVLKQENLPFSTWLGIGVSIVGLWLLASSAAGHATDRRALPWALLAMLATSFYSLSDKAATAHIESLGSVIGFISVGFLCSWLILSWMLKQKTGKWIPACRIDFRIMLVGGICVCGAYVLVIHAMRFLPSAEVVSYTNAGIVIAVLFSIFLFKEKHAWKRRLLGAMVVSTGLGIIALGPMIVHHLPDWLKGLSI